MGGKVWATAWPKSAIRKRKHWFTEGVSVVKRIKWKDQGVISKYWRAQSKIQPREITAIIIKRINKIANQTAKWESRGLRGSDRIDKSV